METANMVEPLIQTPRNQTGNVPLETARRFPAMT